MKYIHFFVFLISFTIGLFATYVMGNDIRTVYVYPKPDNAIQYKDISGQCFKYSSHQVKCPANSADIKKIPKQVE